MGFFDKIMDAAGSILGESDEGSDGDITQKQTLIDSIGDIFKGDSLGSMVENFTKKGLGDTISSWIGKGANMPISIDQIKEVLGTDKILDFAQKAGISQDKAASLLKDFLPGIIDKVTPDGKVEDD
jgi:uncharacterized protein YidB (DUF937 family)